MSDEQTLLALAERCEDATGPIFVLEDDIARLIHQLDGRMWSGLAKPYTSSLDAAMTLVPEGWNVQFERTGSASRACVWKAARNHSRYAATPSLALCAAALKARAAHSPSDEDKGQ